MGEGRGSWHITLCRLYAIKPWGHQSHYSHNNFVLQNCNNNNYCNNNCNNFFHTATIFLQERVSVSNLCKEHWASCGVRGKEMQDPNSFYSFFPTCQSPRCTYSLIKKREILEGSLQLHPTVWTPCQRLLWYTCSKYKVIFGLGKRIK